jgi:hypothetical protein
LEQLDARRKPERFERILEIIETLQPTQLNSEIATKWRLWQGLCARAQTKDIPKHLKGAEIKSALRAALINIIASQLHG